jgi:hypothetical protein
LLIGGSFTILQPNDASEGPCAYAARLNSDGTAMRHDLDVNELPEIASTRCVLPDGRVLIGGNFSSFQPTGT